MKKKILLLILLLIPFFVKAEDYSDLTKIWQIKDNNEYDGTYYANINYIKYKKTLNQNKTIFKSIEKYSGKETVLNASYNSYHLFYNNKIMIIDYKNTNIVYTFLYDCKLNLLSEQKLEDFNIDYAARYEKDNLIITGTKQDDDGDYYRVVYIVDYEGKIIANDTVKTVNATSTFKNSTDGLFFADYNNNNYYLKENKIVIENLNEDGSYLIAQNRKILKYSSTGEKLKEIDIPEGEGARIAKKGDKFYVDAGVYRELINAYERTFYFSIKLYLIDQNLNILKNNTIPENNHSDFKSNQNPSDKDRNYHGIMNKDNVIYVNMYQRGYADKYYSINENLEYTEASKQEQKYESEKSAWKISVEEKNDYGNNQQDYELYKRISNKYTLDEAYDRLSITKDGDNTVVTINYEKKTKSNDNNSESLYTKLDLIYLDKDLNEIFKKEIYDWTLAFEGGSCGSQEVKRKTGVFDKYIVLLANSNEQNYFYIFDKEGNIVKDLSGDIDYPELSISNLLINERGMYVELQEMRIMCTRGAAVDENGEPIVLGDSYNPNRLKTLMIYYSYPFLINANIKGKGNIKASYVSALEGTIIEFIVEPEPGYVLGEIKVTDANGNVVTFTDNKFTMPSADVTIEATFIPINPNTKTFTLYLAIVLGGISLIALYLFSQRKKYLK